MKENVSGCFFLNTVYIYYVEYMLYQILQILVSLTVLYLSHGLREVTKFCGLLFWATLYEHLKSTSHQCSDLRDQNVNCITPTNCY